MENDKFNYNLDTKWKELKEYVTHLCTYSIDDRVALRILEKMNELEK